MTTLDSGPLSSSNPFAHPKCVTQNKSFTKTVVFPGKATTSKREILTTIDKDESDLDSSITTPKQKTSTAPDRGDIAPKTNWRLLWRGGIEIGEDGWRLEGVTFFALISFTPSTPSCPANPFAHLTPHPSQAPSLSSPFHSLTGENTDLYLSLESMRGRKYLQLRGVIDLPEDEVLEGDEDQEEMSRVQMSISPDVSLLVAYFTDLLCREKRLSSKGRTLTAVVIGLGDQEVDTTSKTTILQGKLRLYVGRKRPPPPLCEKKVRPGEPLPRAPLLLLQDAYKPLRPFARTFSRSSSTSIYHPPPSTTPIPPVVLENPVSMPVTGRTPGRRGEKRARQNGQDEERKRKAGRIIADRRVATVKTVSTMKMADLVANQKLTSAATQVCMTLEKETKDDEDIFGKQADLVAPLMKQVSSAGERYLDQEDTEQKAEMAANDTTAKKRARIPQLVLDNKASIRKQTLSLLEERGVLRTHDEFKEIFGATTKGVYFSFRNQLQHILIAKVDIQRIIHNHLNMYLSLPEPINDAQHSEEQTTLFVGLEKENVSVSPTYVDGKIKLEAVAEEDEL
nr:hypothetical protein L203_00576 [Cryptococcus depauperatus CBS 7841]